MKRSLILFMILLISFMALQACKTSAEAGRTQTKKAQGIFSVKGMTGTPISNNLANRIHLQMAGFIASGNEVGGMVTSIQFVIKQNDLVLSAITPKNCALYDLTAYADNGDFKILPRQTKKIRIEHKKDQYIENVFGQNIPNNMDIIVTILDDNGYIVSKTLNSAFYWTPF